MDRLTLLRPTPKKCSDKIRLMTNYNPMNPNLQDILKNFEGLLLMTRKSVITPDQIQITYSRSPQPKGQFSKIQHRFPT